MNPAGIKASKRCRKCGETKPADAFSIIKGTALRGPRLTSECRQCKTADAVQWAKDNPVKARRNARNVLLRQYGLDVDTYQALFDAQGGLCALCGKPEPRKWLAVDHDHLTGRIRGLLCTVCNRMLGQLEANPGWYHKALAYLEGS